MITAISSTMRFPLANDTPPREFCLTRAHRFFLLSILDGNLKMLANLSVQRMNHDVLYSSDGCISILRSCDTILRAFSES